MSVFLVVEGDKIKLEPDVGWAWEGFDGEIVLKGTQSLLSVEQKRVIIKTDFPQTHKLGNNYKTPTHSTPGTIQSVLLSVDDNTLSTQVFSKAACATEKTSGSFQAVVIQPASTPNGVLDPVLSKPGQWHVVESGPEIMAVEATAPQSLFLDAESTSIPAFRTEPPSPPQPKAQSAPQPPSRFDTTYNRNNASMLKQLQEANKYKKFIEEAARRYNFKSSIICGIGSRESHWGLALTPPGPGGRGDFAERGPRRKGLSVHPLDGPGYGRGLMQIDYDWHEFARTGNWQNPRENIMYADKVLDDARKFFQRKASHLSEDEMLRATIAAYNAGLTAIWRAILEKADVDTKTTGKDYSRDVLNRSGWFQLHGWE